MVEENIEIIDGIKVDWNLYKGSKIKRSKASYIEFCKIISEVEFDLKSDFIRLCFRRMLIFQ